MDLNGLESADPIERKLLAQCRFRIVWDHLGWFHPQVVPVARTVTLKQCDDLVEALKEGFDS
jgi:hypothetical protein